MWRVEIPLPIRLRPWLSSNDRDHWGRRKTLSNHYRKWACQEAQRVGFPLLDKVWIDASLAFGDRRRRDAHNYMPTIKACIDGLVDAGVIPDDNDSVIKRISIQRDEHCPKGISLVIFEEGETIP